MSAKRIPNPPNFKRLSPFDRYLQLDMLALCVSVLDRLWPTNGTFSRNLIIHFITKYCFTSIKHSRLIIYFWKHKDIFIYKLQCKHPDCFHNYYQIARIYASVWIKNLYCRICSHVMLVRKLLEYICYTILCSVQCIGRTTYYFWRYIQFYQIEESLSNDLQCNGNAT